MKEKTEDKEINFFWLRTGSPLVLHLLALCTYTHSCVPSFLKPTFIICMASLVVNPTNAASRYMRPLAHNHTQTHRLQRLGHAHTSEIKQSDYEDRVQSLRRRPPYRHSTNPKVSSAIAEDYHYCILTEVQLAHDRLRIMRQAQDGGSAPHADWGTVHHMHYRRMTPQKSTQLLDSSHCNELQERLPTIERPFQIYLTHRTTLSKRRPSNDKPKCRSKPPKNHPFSPD